MIYTDFTKIPYSFLHDAIFIILCRRYKLKNIYIDNKGEVCLTFNEILKDDAIKDILTQLIPQDISLDKIHLEYNLSYSYSDDGQQTYVYSPDGINYKTLQL